MPLREHQIGPSAWLKKILAAHGSGVDFSITGAGKTYVAASAALDVPTLVVHPKVARSSWVRAADSLGLKFSYVGYEELRAGNTPFGRWSNGVARRKVFYRCQCCQRTVDFEQYEPCYCHPKGIHCIETKSRQHDYGGFVFHPAVQQVIFDEVHRCSGMDSLNADILIAAKRQRKTILGLSATAAVSPLGLRALGYTLDLHNLDKDLFQPVIGLPTARREVRPNFYKWARRYGCRRDERFRGFKWMVSGERQVEIMTEIRDLIIPSRGIRITESDIPGFPGCDIQAELYDVDSPQAIDRLYAEMHESLELLKARQEHDVAPDSPLTRELRCRQEIELLKVPLAAEVGQDFLDKGFSLVFFVNFRQTIDELSKRFPEARIIDGTTPGRDEAVSLFQANTIDTLIVNSYAGGECLSMQDLDGRHQRVGLVMPNHSAAKMRQLFGRLPRDGGKSTAVYRVLLAAGTIETRIHRNLTQKLNNLDALNDGDLA